MKNFIVLFLGVCLSLFCMHFVNALPSVEEVTVETQNEVLPETGKIEIEARATCDLIGGTAGDRLCAAHCIAKGYRGGWCDSRKVCNCRK